MTRYARTFGTVPVRASVVPNAELLGGDWVTVPARPHWGRGIIEDASDRAHLHVRFTGKGTVLFGSAMVEPVGEAEPDG